MNVDPASLKVELPPEEDLKPFPTKLAFEFPEAGEGALKIAVCPAGELLAVGSKLGLQILDVTSGYCLWKSPESFAVTVVEFSMNGKLVAVGLADGRTKIFSVPGMEMEKIPCVSPSWVLENDCLTIAAPSESAGAVTRLHWHAKGKYLAAVCANSTVAHSLSIHSLSSGKTLKPLSNKKSTGKIVDAKFHPSKPWLVVTSERSIKLIDLKASKTEKIFKAGNSTNHLSSCAVHISGDHYVGVSEDRRLVWFDLDLGSKPWRVLKNFQDRTLTKILFHNRFHLLSVASDDGTVQLFHARVYDDLSKNPLLVPVKKISTGDNKTSDIAFHPRLPWLFTANEDGKIRLWV